METHVEFAEAIAQYLRDQDYTEKRLSEMGLTGLAWNSLARRSASAWVVNFDDPLALLIRAFYICEAVKTSEAEKLFPKEILRDLLTSGLMVRDGEQLQARCMLTHFAELIIACDSPRRAATGIPTDLVLGMNPTTRLLARCSMIHRGSKVLDLGAGCGPLSLAASHLATSVVGTDVNRHAIDYARFNAALN